MPVRSFFSSRSFWKFSIFIMVPCSCSTISVMSARAAAGEEEGEEDGGYSDNPSEEGGYEKEGTSAVSEVVMCGREVLAEPLHDEFVVQQAVERPEEEDVEGQVTHLLLLEVSTQSLDLPVGPGVQRGRVLMYGGQTPSSGAGVSSTHRQARSSSTRHSECFWR